MAERRSMPCLEGRPHKYGPLREGGNRDSPWDRSFQKCERCGEVRYDLVANCGAWNCEDLAGRTYSRLVANAPNYPDWKAGVGVAYELREDTGTCDWCMEKYQREDQGRERIADRLINKDWPETARYFANEARRKERELIWRQESAQRLETARQRAFLRQGRETLTAIRRHLHAPASSRQQESRPERTSPTS